MVFELHLRHGLHALLRLHQYMHSTTQHSSHGMSNKTHLIEDIALCEGVQRGLESPAYGVGRYAPSVEMAMHHFHCLLHANLSG